MPTLCVVIKIYNEFELLRDCIQSLINQTLKPMQIIIVDDGSPEEQVSKEILRLSEKCPEINIELLRLPLKPKADLDTVGRTWKKAWFKIKNENLYDYYGMLDVDTRLMENYYEKIISEMEQDRKIACASGTIVIKSQVSEYVEQINIGAKVGRKDARGSGKVIRISFLEKIAEKDFPEVDWDTWINTKAKVKGFKCPQIDNIYMYQERPTSRVAGKDYFRSGSLSYYFGYNPILVVTKMILAKKGALTILKGYYSAKKKKWRLADSEVRQYFSWGFFLHF